MAIVTDQTVTINGVEVGISKPIQTLIASGDFTYEELSKFAFVGRHDFVNNKCGSYDEGSSWGSGSSESLMSEKKFPVLNDPTKAWDNVSYIYAGAGNRQNDNYGKMVLVYNMVSSDSNINKNFNDNNTACIVTELNPRLLKMTCNIYSSSVNANVGESGSYSVYEPEVSRNIVWRSDDTSAPFSTLCCQKFEDISYFVFPLYNNVFSSSQDINGNVSSTNARINYMYNNFDTSGHYFSAWSSNDVVQDFLEGASYSSSFTGAHDFSDDRGDKLLTVNYSPYSAVIRVRASSLDTALKQCAGCGLYFEYDGDVYKPITTDGIVTGYTDDLDKNSDWDLINDVTGNTIPDSPSGGGGGGGEDDDYAVMGIGTGSNVGGLSSYAIMSLSDLADLLSDFEQNKEEGMSVANNFICLYKLGTISSFLCNTRDFNIVMQAGAKNNFVSSRSDYQIVSSQKSEVTLGSFDVPRMTNTFYDFNPFTSYELFIPCCGWIPLPDTVAGRTITVYLVFDLASCICKGIVRISGTTVAECSGVLGSSVPFGITEGALNRAALVQGITQTLSSLVVGGIAVASGGKAGAGIGAMSLANVASGVNETVAVSNTNYTAVKGGNGDISAFANGEYCTIKINYPVIDNIVNSPMFGHSVGYLCNEVGTLSNYTGFTVCKNPHVTFSASAEERDEIERLLSTGVIL